MEEFFSKAAQLIASLSILIVLHEMGHFLAARYFKIRVEKFYLFFNPGFSIFKFKRGETTFGLGWLPLGGYVKISGMIDESMDKEAMKEPPKDYEFRSKPAWQRLIIMVGGVVVNLILGYVIYVMVLFSWGKDRLPMENMTYGVHCDSVMYDYGFQEGDRILGVVENPALRFLNEVSTEILIYDARQVRLQRNGEEMVITLPDTIGSVLLDEEVRTMFAARFPFVADSVIADKNAEKAGFLKGDSIVAVNEKAVPFFSDFQKELRNFKEEEVAISLYRNSELQSIKVEVSENGTIGIAPKNPSEYLEYEHIDYSFFEAIPAGFSETTDKLGSYISSLKLLFSKSGASQIGGFGTIGGLFPTPFSWQAFWNLTAFLSLILAFMNILPIPALDGGHVMFLLYEIIAGRPPGEKFMEYAQYAGMFFLLALILFANGNDILRLFR